MSDYKIVRTYMEKYNEFLDIIELFEKTLNPEYQRLMTVTYEIQDAQEAVYDFKRICALRKGLTDLKMFIVREYMKKEQA